jgi:hypothetical protein
MARIKLKKKINIGRVVAKVTASVIALYVGGTILTEVGNVMNNTHSPFYKGLSLIGWTVGSATGETSSTCSTITDNTTTWGSCITDVSGSGILAVIGIVAIAAIVIEFVEISY